MGGEVVSSYLVSKFSSTLSEAEADPSRPSQIVSGFRSIGMLINSKSKNSTIPVDLLYDLIDALSECRIFAHQRRTAAASKTGLYFFRVINIDPLCEFLFKGNMRRRLSEIERKLNSTSPEDDNGTSRSGLVLQQTHPILDPSLIIGFESQVKEIKDLLMTSTKEEEEAEGSTAIGIVGRFGCGKTALAQKVFANPRIQEEFSPRIWVCLSNMPLDDERVDPRVRFLNHILKEIGYDFSDLEYGDFSVVKLLDKLQHGLMGKRYLIVLDDAWRADEWYADLGSRLPRSCAAEEFLSHGLPKGGGGAIIVTSRREDVIRWIVGDKHVFCLEQHLNNEVCSEIFSGVLRHQGKISLDHAKLMKMEDDVIRNCDGLPLFAKTLANIIPNLL